MKSIKAAGMLILTLATLSIGAQALAQSAVINNGSDANSRLNMRTQPNKEADSIGKFYSGVQVEIDYDAGDGWSAVTIGSGINTVSGFMVTKYLTASSEVDGTRSRTVVSPYGTPSVVLRSRPSNSYDAVTMLTVGDSVQVIGTSGDFSYVLLGDGTVGCLSNEELK